MKYKILKKNFWCNEIITNCAKLCANGTITFGASNVINNLISIKIFVIILIEKRKGNIEYDFVKNYWTFYSNLLNL